jgi:hypothetical protein
MVNINIQFQTDLVSTRRWKEKSASDGHRQCEKEMEDHLLECQQILEKEPRSDTPL